MRDGDEKRMTRTRRARTCPLWPDFWRAAPAQASARPGASADP